MGASPRRTLGTAAAVGLVAAIAYLPALRSGFTADDFFILARVKALDGLATPLAYFSFGFFDYYRPVAFLSHAIDWEIWGGNPFGFHLRNVLLHAGSSALVFLIARRLFASPVATIAALLFALRPASHEAVYWMAARFDLLATFFALLAVWALSDDRRAWRVVGLIAFALGLLSKESAIAVLIIAPAWDTFIGRRPARDVIDRLLPLLGIALLYAWVRSAGADLDALGGGHRLPKLIMAGAAIGAVVLAARRAEREAGAWLPEGRWPVAAALALGAGAAAALVLPAVSSWAAEKVGFTAYAAWYSVTPVVFPSPSPEWFSPSTASEAVPALVVVLLVLALAGWFARTAAADGRALLAAAWIVAALVPVSSMTGGLRYLHLAGAGVSLAAGWLVERLSQQWRVATAAVVTLTLAVSLTQIAEAGRRWRAASVMTQHGVQTMAESLEPCGTRDVLLLTAPVGIGGVYANFYWEAFDVIAGCSPRAFTSLVRVVRDDATVEIVASSADAIEFIVPGYRGQIVASEDLRNFGIRIPAGATLSVDTAAGTLATRPDGTAQRFTFTPNDWARQVLTYYYSAGTIHRLPRPANPAPEP